MSNIKRYEARGSSGFKRKSFLVKTYITIVLFVVKLAAGSNSSSASNLRSTGRAAVVTLLLVYTCVCQQISSPISLLDWQGSSRKTPQKPILCDRSSRYSGLGKGGGGSDGFLEGITYPTS